ncbi:TetR/AcrR family transcriptional regulator [Sphingobium sp. DC-2]|uniref:TetR/AcrR family transcriptional regulator n=1 Tax=Sphingobium sp. DC-2 TaxID=1303256 RepID=UPI00068A38FC|nr:TetR/AcrR family transcriptional regulator [Sphingobium sp. DC-2]
MTAQPVETKERAEAPGDQVRRELLDAAEELFAERGFFGVSVREITEKAGVRLAAVNYHFGTKEGLFEKVLERRATSLNAAREKLLRACDPGNKEWMALSGAEKIRTIIQAFCAPLSDYYMSGDPGWRNYSRLIARVAVHRLWVKKYVSPMFDHIGADIISRLMAIAPHIEYREALHCFQFMVGLLLNIYTGNDREKLLSKGRFEADSILPLIQDMEVFCTAGMCRLLNIDQR